MFVEVFPAVLDGSDSEKAKKRPKRPKKRRESVSSSSSDSEPALKQRHYAPLQRSYGEFERDMLGLHKCQNRQVAYFFKIKQRLKS